MPYSRAHYFVGFVLLVTIVGFWTSYFTEIGKVPLAFHVHAFTATTWVILVMAQSWSIHNRKKLLHRTVGKLSLFVFPFLITGFVMIINVSAERFSTVESSGIMKLGPSFGIGMALAIVAYLLLYYKALNNRRTLHLHAGYMLATPLILFESPFSRIMLRDMPATIFTGSQGPQLILDAIVISITLAVVFSLVVYLRNRKKNGPFLVAAILMAVQAVAMAVAGDVEWMRNLFAAYGAVPAEISLPTGFLLGALISWLGWTGPIKKRKAMAPAQ